MNENFFNFFHQSSKKLPGIPIDSNKRPDKWKKVDYKKYPRLPKVKLPPVSIKGDLQEVITNRKSSRDFSGKSISKKELSALLKYSSGINKDRLLATENKKEGNQKKFSRMYPSGGACYPIEVYPIVLNSSSGYSPGVYHYDVEGHALDTLKEGEINTTELKKLFTFPWVGDASVVIVLTALFWRNLRYKDRGYRLTLLEAGHIGQNLYLAAESLGLKSCGYCGTRDEAVEELLGIDGITESVVYAFVVGK